MSRPDWKTLGPDWPNADASRFVDAGGLRFHVQIAGDGPPILLIHGAGAATHSWRDLLPLLARDYTVIAPDLPGHGFTATPRARGLTLPGMAASLTALLHTLGHDPVLAIGHSAGAAIAARLTLDGAIRPKGLVAINGAFKPFSGLAGLLFPAMAKIMYWNPLSASLFSRAARDPEAPKRVIRSTGSEISEDGFRQYGVLLRTQSHIDGALGMMANWDVGPLTRALPGLGVPALILIGERDRAVTPSEQMRIARTVPDARIESFPDLGHLAHEEDPPRIAAAIAAFAAEAR